MANILLLGATGKFGIFFAHKLLTETDHNVTLFSRHVDESDGDGNRLKAFPGDASSYGDLSKALENQDIVYCAISGSKLPEVARNLVDTMESSDVNRLIYMGAVGIYDEIPETLENGTKYNFSNATAQIPNHRAVEIVEDSDLDYTILRPGLLRAGEADDFVITKKGEPAKGYISTIESVAEYALGIINNPEKDIKESISITRNMAK